MQLLSEFRDVFKGGIYRHRSSTIGDKLSRQFYEDLYSLGRSAKFNRKVDNQGCVLNTKNRVTGKSMRRGDGTFGEKVASADATEETNFNVAKGPTVNVQIGVEVKILATAMIKQIDRVVNDLFKQAREFERVTNDAISVAIVGVNHASKYTSHEGDRTYDKPGSGPAPSKEATKAISELKSSATQHFDEFLIVPFEATNRPPYPFSWVDKKTTMNKYSAVCQRTLSEYDSRF